MLKIETVGDRFRFNIEGDDRQVLAELTELGGLTMACLLESGEQAHRGKATCEMTLLRMADALAEDMVRVAGEAIDKGTLREGGQSSGKDEATTA